MAPADVPTSHVDAVHDVRKLHVNSRVRATGLKEYTRSVSWPYKATKPGSVSPLS